MVPRVLIKQLFYKSSSLVCNLRIVVFIFFNTTLWFILFSKEKNLISRRWIFLRQNGSIVILVWVSNNCLLREELNIVLVINTVHLHQSLFACDDFLRSHLLWSSIAWGGEKLELPKLTGCAPTPLSKGMQPWSSN